MVAFYDYDRGLNKNKKNNLLHDLNTFCFCFEFDVSLGATFTLVDGHSTSATIGFLEQASRPERGRAREEGLPSLLGSSQKRLRGERKEDPQQPALPRAFPDQRGRTSMEKVERANGKGIRLHSSSISCRSQ